MNKTLATACALACIAGSVHAQSNVTVYGNFDEYIGYIRSSSGNHVTGLNDGSILRSRLGFRGSEDIGGGYLVKFTLEQGLNADTGTGADSTRLFDRQAWVGIATPQGEIRIGRQNTSIFFIGGAIDYTERTTFGSLINTFGVPSRFDNDLSYKSPRMGGVQLDLHYALPENSGSARNHAIYQLGVDYQGGPFRAGYAGLLAKPNDATATVHRNVEYHNAYANYKYDSGTLYAAFVRSNNSTANANGLNGGTILNNVSNPNNYFSGTDVNANRFYNIWQLSADYRINPQWRVGALFGVIRDTSDASGGEGGAKGANVGAFYDLSKRTTLYTFASVMKNEANGGFRFSGSAGPSANLAGSDINDRRLTGIQTGIVHKF